MQDVDWNILKTVLCVAQSGGVSKAARQLEVSDLAVGRRL